MFELPSGAEIQSIIAILKSGLGFFIPEIYLSILFMGLIILDLVLKGRKNAILGWTTLLGLGGSFYFIAQQHAMQARELFLACMCLTSTLSFSNTSLWPQACLPL